MAGKKIRLITLNLSVSDTYGFGVAVGREVAGKVRTGDVLLV
jgi:hypothetical protein